MTARTPSRIGILGGTGALGQGLARRFVAAGMEVHIGSRDAAKARAAVTEILAGVETADGSAIAGSNLDASIPDVVVVAVPFAALDATLAPLAAALAGRIVVCAVNPLAFDAAGPRPVSVEEGSAAQRAAAMLPDARVTAAFHTVSSVALTDTAVPMDDDVPVVGDDPEAVATVVELADAIEGCRGVAAGPLRGAATLEALVALLIDVNRRHRRHVGIRFSRL